MQPTKPLVNEYPKALPGRIEILYKKNENVTDIPRNIQLIEKMFKNIFFFSIA